MFVVFEGIDGAGKSTTIQGVADRLREQGREVRVISEVGSEVTGRAGTLRRQLMACDNPHQQLQMILTARMLAQTKVRQWLDEGCVVLQDRYVLSTIAYQGRKMRMPGIQMIELMFDVHEFIKPELTVVLDLHPVVASRRLARRAGQDPFDSFTPDRFKIIRSTLRDTALLPYASHDALVIDADRDPERVTTTAASAVTYKLYQHRHTAKAQTA